MRSNIIQFALIGLTFGCGQDPTSSSSYLRALSSSDYQSRIQCSWTGTVGGSSYSFNYEFSTSQSGAKYLACSVRNSSGGADSYFSPAPSSSTGQCPLIFDIDGGASGSWTFSVSGQVAVGTYSKAGSPNDGATSQAPTCTVY